MTFGHYLILEKLNPFTKNFNMIPMNYNEYATKGTQKIKIIINLKIGRIYSFLIKKKHNSSLNYKSMHTSNTFGDG